MRRFIIVGLAALELLLFVAIVKTSVLAVFPHAQIAAREVRFDVSSRHRIAYHICVFCKTGAAVGTRKILLIAPLQAG